MTAKGMAHVQAAFVYAVSTDAVYRSGQHYQRDARRGDDDRREQRDVGILVRDANADQRDPCRRRH